MYFWHSKGEKVVVETFGHLDQFQESAEEVQRTLKAEGYRKVRILNRWSSVGYVQVARRYVTAEKPAGEEI